MKATYSTPRVKKYGSMKALTRGAAGSEVESSDLTNGDPILLAWDQDGADVNDFKVELTIMADNDIIPAGVFDADLVNLNTPQGSWDLDQGPGDPIVTPPGGLIGVRSDDANLVANLNIGPVDRADPIIVAFDSDGD